MLDLFPILVLTKTNENFGTDYPFFNYGVNIGKTKGKLF